MKHIDRPAIARLSAGMVCATLMLFACARDKDEEAVGKAEPAAAPAESGPGVNIDEATQKRLGLGFAIVGEAQGQSKAEGIATVLDSAALISTLDDLAAARSDVSSQEQNTSRLQGLYQDGGNASLQALEAARTQLAAARARLTAAQSRARADWGSALIDANDAASRTALRDLRNGDGTLLRAEFNAELADASSLHYSVGAAREGELAAAQFIAFSRAPTTSTSGVAVTLALPARDSKNAPRPGARFAVIAASTQGASQPLVPESAAIADGGALWCYVESAPGRFDRIALDADHRIAQGYPAAEARPGARVVVRGAPLLLSLERGAGAAAPAADED